jgi:hypothetical protein
MERASIPFGFPEQTVTRGSGRIIDNGKAFADQAIE